MHDGADDEANDAAANDRSGDPQKLFVGGLPRDADEGLLRYHFDQFGLVEYLKVPKRYDGRPRGHCIIRYATLREAEFCLSRADDHRIFDPATETYKSVEVKAFTGTDRPDLRFF